MASGVAGCVINDKNEVLVVQERWLRSLKIKHWKLPGGVAEPGGRVKSHDILLYANVSY